MCRNGQDWIDGAIAFALIFLTITFAFALGLVYGGGQESAASHNEHGGYIDACGELPPQLGDDC